MVGGLTAYWLRDDHRDVFRPERLYSKCEFHLPLSATRSVRVASASGGIEASCAVAGLAAEDAASQLRGAGMGFAAGEPDENLDPQCQVHANATVEDCRVTRLIDVPDHPKAIMELPMELHGDAACSMLREPFREVAAQEVELAAFGTRCLAQTVDGTLRVGLAVFPFARLDQYCNPDDARPTELAGHAVTVCGRSDRGGRDIYAAAFDDPGVSGAVLADIQLDNLAASSRRTTAGRWTTG